jgi:hypothetical protein
MLPTACSPANRGNTSSMFGPMTAPNISRPNRPGSRRRSATSGPKTITSPTTVKPNAGLDCTSAQFIDGEAAVAGVEIGVGVDVAAGVEEASSGGPLPSAVG